MSAYYIAIHCTIYNIRSMVMNRVPTAISVICARECVNKFHLITHLFVREKQNSTQSPDSERNNTGNSPRCHDVQANHYCEDKQRTWSDMPLDIFVVSLCLPHIICSSSQ